MASPGASMRLRMRTLQSVARVSLSLGLALSLTAVLSGQRGRGAGQAAPAASILADGDYTIRPPFSVAPEMIYDNHIPHGTIHRFTMKSADSKIYKGISRGRPG